MNAQITYFVHSTTSDNENGVSSGWNDIDLSILGVQQSEALRKTLNDRNFDIIFCSDLKRARQTAEIAFSNHPNIVYDSRLRECNYGAMNGSPSDIVEPLQEQNITTPFPNGESYEDVGKRMKELLNDIRTNHGGKSIAFIGSKAPQIVLDVLLKGMTWEEAFAHDWRKTKSWQAGWTYHVDESVK